MKISPEILTLRVAFLALLFAFPPQPCRAQFRDNDLSTPEWQVPSPPISPAVAVPGAGDLNGDGFSDLVFRMGSFLEVYFGSTNGPPTTPSQTIDLGVTGTHLASGYADIASAGDYNGDGYDDLLVADRLTPFVGYARGAVNLYAGSASGLSSTSAWSYEYTTTGTRWTELGYVVASVGDVNGDFLADFMVSGSVDGVGYFLSLFLSSGSGPPTDPARTIAGVDFEPGSFGGAQDIDGDGYTDVFLNVVQGPGLQILYGAAESPLSRSSTITGLTRGRALGDLNGDGFGDVGGIYGDNGVGLYLGSASGISGAAGATLWAFIPNQHGFHYYTFVGPAGDLNGDGLADIAVSEHGSPDTGFLYFGRRQDLGYPYLVAGQVPLEGGVNRLSFLPAGDVNADGLSDMVGIVDDPSPVVSLHCGVGRPPLAQADFSRSSAFPSGGDAGAVCPAGDINGDGYEDVMVGTPLFSNGQINEGRAALYLGSPTGPSTVPDWTFEPNQPYALLGSALCSAGDLNGDGYGDFVVGAYNHSNAVYIEGSIFVFYGGPGGVSGGPEIISGGQLGAGFGYSLAALHDLDGDGYDDIAVGAYAYDGTVPNEGAVFVFRGSPTGVQPTPSQSLQMGLTSAEFGYAISFAGDVNADGQGDLLVGAPFSSSGATAGGEAFLYLGNGHGLSNSPASSVLGTEANAHLGQSVCGLGDTDGDGKSDVAVAAPNAAGGGVDRGRVSIYLGTSVGLTNTPSSQISGTADHAEWGGSIWAPGDINVDGLSDLAVLGTGTPCTAAAYLGGVGGVVATPAWSPAYVSQAYPAMASSSGQVDLNGDGVGDILVPRPGLSDAFSVYYGNAAPTGGHFSQAKGIAGPVLPDGGEAAGPNYIQIRVDAKSAAGRATIRLEFEGKDRTQAFDGLGTRFSGLRLTGPAGLPNGSLAEFSEVLTGLPFQSQIKWRVRTRSRSPYFPTTPWRERPLTRMVGWTVRTPCETCVSGILDPPREQPQLRAVQLAGNPVTLRGRGFPLAVWSVRQGEAVLEVLDVTGRLISTNQVRLEAQTWNHLTIRPSAMPGASGVYFIRVRAPWSVDARRVIVE